MVDLIVDCFREGSNLSRQGIAHEMVYCMTPLNLNLNKITQPVDIWYGTEDGRIDLDGVKLIAEELPDCSLHIRDGYSEHIYYALFEEIIT